MLLDSDRPAMLILDDALAYSDNARMETMFDILTEASTNMQILVRTCREDAFRRLGVHVFDSRNWSSLAFHNSLCLWNSLKSKRISK
jgi:hypothetical protein